MVPPRLLASLLACLTAGLGCRRDEEGGRPVVNRCAQTLECAAGERCDETLGICVSDQVLEPYSIALRVVPSGAPGTAGLAPLALPARLVTRSFNFGTLRLRDSALVRGRVVDETGRTIEAEVAFAPNMSGYLVGGTSTFTQPLGDEQAFTTTLDPDTAYDVQVFPLGLDSERYPPAVFTLSTTPGVQTTTFRYPAQVALGATLVDEEQKPADVDSKVRLRRKSDGAIASSVGRIRAGGAFELRATQAVLDTLPEHELVLSVQRRGDPLLVSIAFAAERLRANGTIVMPTLPASVLFSAAVEIDELEDTINADLTFVSSFPLPTEAVDVRDRDWCRLRLPGSPEGTFSCSATVRASVGSDLRVMARLIPGDYQVFVAPTGEITDQLRVATAALREDIQSQPSGVQEGRVFGLARATLYTGQVVNPRGKPMPAVTITANALGVQRDLEQVALYNRTAQQTSDERGDFQLAVDTGYYDLVAAPPDGTGFAWVLIDNRRIGGNSAMRLPLQLSPQIPVVAGGLLLTADNRPVANAQVEAFAIVPSLDPAKPGERAVRIARAVSGEDGVFSLLLPQSIGEPDTSVSLEAGVSAINLADAGATFSEAGASFSDAGASFGDASAP